MLQQAGLTFEVIPAKIDELVLLSKHPEIPPEEKSLLLSREKALAVSRENMNALVIGSDQILCLDDMILNKAGSREDALNKLKKLRGKTHKLISGVAVAYAGEILWQAYDIAELTMRHFDEAFLNAYADMAGDALTSCVGAYQIEGPGVWLFSKIEGDFFTIMGMPLTALLGYLYEKQGVRP